MGMGSPEREAEKEGTQVANLCYGEQRGAAPSVGDQCQTSSISRKRGTFLPSMSTVSRNIAAGRTQRP